MLNNSESGDRSKNQETDPGVKPSRHLRRNQSTRNAAPIFPPGIASKGAARVIGYESILAENAEKSQDLRSELRGWPAAFGLLFD